MKNTKEVFITESAEETQKLARDFIKSIVKSSYFRGSTPKALVIALFGDLGSGKTTFVQGLAKGFGIEKRVISPTFAIIRKYGINVKYHPFDKLRTRISKIKTTRFAARLDSVDPRRTARRAAQKVKNFYHLDLYRLQSENDLKTLGIEEIINNPQNIIVIEWAERMEKLLPQKRADIKFEYLDRDKRRISIYIKDQI